MAAFGQSAEQSVQLRDIIVRSSFSVMEGRYVYAKVSAESDTAGHFMVVRDTDEVTVVTRQELLGGLQVIERNKESYALIALNVSLPFYSVGFIAAVTAKIADAGTNVLVVSTYSKDYIMVREDRLSITREALLSLGLNES